MLRPEEATRAVGIGLDGIIVSNHGGRKLDGVPAGIEMLPRVAEAVAGKVEVLMDGGVRRGTDVLKALALGAQFCFVGRPMLYAAVAAGEEGVRRAIALLKEEVSRNMALAGLRSIAEVTPELVRRIGTQP